MQVHSRILTNKNTSIASLNELEIIRINLSNEQTAPSSCVWLMLRIDGKIKGLSKLQLSLREHEGTRFQQKDLTPELTVVLILAQGKTPRDHHTISYESSCGAH